MASRHDDDTGEICELLDAELRDEMRRAAASIHAASRFRERRPGLRAANGLRFGLRLSNWRARRFALMEHA